MKTIERYVFRSFLSSFVLAFLVLSFVLTIGLLIQIVGFIMDGVPMSLVGEFCAVSLPETLQWSMPLALLVSAILVFSRMSADSEISAMRACGINIVSVMKYPVLFGLACTLLGFWVNNEVVPRGHEVRRTLKSRVSVKTGISLLEPGRMIDDFPNLKLYFGSKEGNWLYDLVVIDYSDPRIDRMLTAEKALVTQKGADIELELYRMTVNPMDADHLTMVRANRCVYTLKDAIKNTKYTRKTKDFRFSELCDNIRWRGDYIRKLEKKGASEATKAELKFARRERSDDLVELNKRFVFAMASICFVLIGIPLGIRSQRKESSIGMAISLAVALGYYLIVILMLSCEKNYAIYPWVLIWLPVVISGALAVYFVRKHL